LLSEHVEIEEALKILEEKLATKSFRKAVGSTVVEAIRTLVDYTRCNVVVPPSDIYKLINNFYIFESRIEYILKVYDYITSGTFSTILKEIFGEEVGGARVDYRALLKELSLYRAELFKLGNIAKEAERSCSQNFKRQR